MLLNILIIYTWEKYKIAENDEHKEKNERWNTLSSKSYDINWNSLLLFV